MRWEEELSGVPPERKGLVVVVGEGNRLLNRDMTISVFPTEDKAPSSISFIQS